MVSSPPRLPPRRELKTKVAIIANKSLHVCMYAIVSLEIITITGYLTTEIQQCIFGE